LRAKLQERGEAKHGKSPARFQVSHQLGEGSVAKKATAKTVKGRKPKPTKAPTDRRTQPGRNTTGLVPFQKGAATGRKPGAKNKFTTKLKDAILAAAEASGSNGKGKNGAIGYLTWLSRAEPAVFGRLLEKVMPLQIDVKDKTDRTMTAPEAVKRLEERGIPVPPALRSLAENVGQAVVHRQEEDYDAELNGEGFEGSETLAPEHEGEDQDDDVEV
jgi:hypothetical protein